MNPRPSSPDLPDAVAEAAAAWTLRHDRGLSAAEQDEFSQWLAADPRHRDAWAEHRWGWDELDRLAGLQASVQAVPDPDLLQPHRPARRWRYWPQVLAAAAALALAAVVWWPARPAESVPPSYALAAPIEERTLDDGTVVALNRGAMLETAFSASERRVHLVRGEANFAVAKNPARPFVVQAGGVEVRAVGTAFNVRLDPKAVEVIVTEGTVAVDSRAPQVPRPLEVPARLVTVGERAVVALGPVVGEPVVAAVGPEEQARALAWQPRLLDFTATPLAEIVAEFNRRNPVRLTLGDPALRAFQLSATIRSDNVEGFVRLLESDFGMQVEWRGETEIVLRRQ